ncbi:hypothetical protein L6452_38201 [Arctium lappa]|uniref:Uncharacterized protein n=1 Tax=Arctium lappa TaxID=4217 RepID=A0ACB8Y5S3_ARCLA|nr:hypothetical protein L6452_38201 [Arctium lappa]
MTSKKTATMLLMCIVILAVAHAEDFEDKPIMASALAPKKSEPPKDKCYVDCEKHCIAGGYAGSFCTLKCENSCRQNVILHGRRMSR